MNLVLTDPQMYDVDSYFKLISETKIQNEFINYRGITKMDIHKEFEYWVQNQVEAYPCFLWLMKITNMDYREYFNDNNSELIGFISYTKATGAAQLFSGLNDLLNFAITEKYENRGIMTGALTNKT